MKKWIIIIAAVVLFMLGYLVKVYLTAVQPVKAAEKTALSIAAKKVQFSKVEHFNLYNGLETVYVIQGKDKKGNNVIVWIPEKSKKVIELNANSGLTQEQAVQKLEQSVTPKKIVSVRLGMENDVPFWEIYYLSDNNLINYYDIQFQTGQWLKKIENL